MYLKLFLEAKPQELPFDDGALPGIIHEAESLLLLRMCKGGGWNYGNARILGEELRPYPLTTANALIALQRSSYAEVPVSIEYLAKAAMTEQSSLALSMTILALDLYGKKADPRLAENLVKLYRENHFFRNIKTAALAVLALDTQMGGRNPFLVAG